MNRKLDHIFQAIIIVVGLTAAVFMTITHVSSSKGDAEAVGSAVVYPKKQYMLELKAHSRYMIVFENERERCYLYAGKSISCVVKD